MESVDGSIETESTALVALHKRQRHKEDKDNRSMDSDENDDGLSQGSDGSIRYNWKDYNLCEKIAVQGSLCVPCVRRCMGGGSTYAPQTERLLVSNLTGLAQCLVLLRRYQMQYGMPYRGGRRDQELVLRQVYNGLFSWAMASIMEKAVEGVTGHAGVKWLILPRMAFAQDPT
eukprot:CAMPEP_0178750258 /NCGR_PEP_ID=MMETSP0744-20121128/9873_1 /TAXON_ID=913974 /ORGANISM="Nitzschia punctata, Strain CCMP561" /LENGTH=172 /DNA_ID=CAMNT_0020403777 /DNA_START=52 /DNA_END=566 /DNA_ORIENTATION=-